MEMAAWDADVVVFWRYVAKASASRGWGPSSRMPSGATWEAHHASVMLCLRW